MPLLSAVAGNAKPLWRCLSGEGDLSQSTGKRVYHTPWFACHERTVIDEDRGERWFCDEAEAIAAAWRPARHPQAVSARAALLGAARPLPRKCFVGGPAASIFTPAAERTA
jgi:hypothetical protein